MALSIPYFYLNPSIPTYYGNEPLLKTNLTEHQKRVLYYIRLLESENPIPILSTSDSQNLYFHTNYAFYADPICTGKSFVILSLLSLHRVLERKKLLTIWSNGLGMNVYSKIENFEIPMSFLVVPHHSIEQWEVLLKQETNIKYFIVNSEASIEQINTYEYEVLIVADLFFDKVCEHFQGFSVSRLIFDDLLHLEIKNIKNKGETNFNNGQSSQFGDLRASFTWFICSQPYLCLQKYKNSHLPFAILIKQIFSFPYSGLIFRSEIESLYQSLENILPSLEINLRYVYSEELINQNIDNIRLDEEIKDIFSSKNTDQVKRHMNTLFIHIANQSGGSDNSGGGPSESIFTILKVEEIMNGLSEQQKNRFKERYNELNMNDPVTYEPIKFPIYMKCCDQIFDLVSLYQCFQSDMRCPFCRKETNFQNCIGIENENFVMNENIWSIFKDLNIKEWNVLYIPSFKKGSKINKRSRFKLNEFIRQLMIAYPCYLLNGGKNNSRKTFEKFKKEKGILIIDKPIESNLHLSFVNRVLVLHPKEYKCENEIVWYTSYFQKNYGRFFQGNQDLDQHDLDQVQEQQDEKKPNEEGVQNDIILNWNDRSKIQISDRELGNFVIGKKDHLKIDILSLF